MKKQYSIRLNNVSLKYILFKDLDDSDFLDGRLISKRTEEYNTYYPCEIGAYASLRKTFIYIESIVVDKCVRNTGVGTRTIKYFQKLWEGTPVLLTAYPLEGGDLNRLVRFYKSLGFVDTHEEYGSYSDKVVMLFDNDS